MTSAKPEVLITKNFPAHVVAALQEIATVHQWTSDDTAYLMPRDEVMKVISRMSAVINQAELRVDQELLEHAPNLKIVANVSIGTDNLDRNALRAHRVWASNTPGHFAYPVAEFTIAGILSVARRLPEADAFVRSGQWNSFQPGRWDGDSLYGKTLGIVGMGDIGFLTGQIASALGMKIIYHSRKRIVPMFKRVDLGELLAVSDVISLHVPYHEQTHELIGAAEIARMKRGALLANTARGRVVNEEALITALLKGHLGGAVLDVFYREPAVPEALKSLNNVLLTPHIAGGTRQARIRAYENAVANVVEVLQGRRPLNPVIQL